MAQHYFSLAQRTVDGTSGAAAWEIRAGASGCSVHRIGLSLAAATASIFGLGRPAAIGITPTTPVTFGASRPVEAVSVATGAMAWGTGPTVPAAFLRRISLPATVGAGIVWEFDGTLVIPASGSLVLWNLAANAVADVWADIQK